MRDYSKEAGYAIEVIDHPYRPGIIISTEKWKGGARSVRQIDERYQPEGEYDADYGPRPGEFEIELRIGDETDSFRLVDVSYKYHIRNPKFENSEKPIGNSLTQEIICDTKIASRSTIEKGPLMQGEFFRHAGPGKMEEKTAVYENDGTSSYYRLWEKINEYRGGRPDRYRDTRVTDKNGVVEYGVVEHGIALGVPIPMNVVYNPEKQI